MSATREAGAVRDAPAEPRASSTDDAVSAAAFDSIADPDPQALGLDALDTRGAARAASGRFKIGPEIGVGGMGRVALVRDLRLLRDVAWKRGDWRLLREARVLSQLEHPGIVPIHDVGFDPDGQAYLAMRVVTGRSLARLLRETPPDQRLDLLRPLLQAAEAVAYAHHRGVVHRDLKPANIMIGGFGESQVVDWGLARVLDDADKPLPPEVRSAVAGRAEGRVGTPGFMSPEQAAGEPADRRSDVYGLGRILERIIAPAEGPDAPEPPAALRAIADRSTAADPAARYADAAAFAADLLRFLDGRRVVAHSYGRAELLARFVRAHRTPLVIVAIGLIALLVFGAVYVVRLGEERAVAERAVSATTEALRRSDRHLARSLVGEARRQLDAGARIEAEVLASQALLLHEDPDARGLLSSVGGAPAVALTWRAPLECPEAQLNLVNQVALCREPDGLALWCYRDGPPRLLWRRTIPVRAARLADGGVVVASSAAHTIHLLDLQGREIFASRPPNNPTRKTAAAGSLAVFESAETTTVADVARREVFGVAPCGGALHAALALAPDDGWPRAGGPFAAVLCRDGTLRRGGSDRPTSLRAPDREGVRMAMFGPDRVVVGTTKGEVVVLDGEGRVLRSGQPTHGMVRLLAPSPDGRLLAVAGDGDPILLLTLPDLAPVGALPRRAKTLVWDAARPGELMTAGHWLERWRVEPADRGRLLDGAYAIPLDDGVVSLDIDPRQPDRLALSFGPAVGVLSATTLSARALPFVTVKGAAVDGTTLLVSGVGGTFKLDADTLAERAMIAPWPSRRSVTLGDATSVIASYGAVYRLVGDHLELLEAATVIDVSVAPSRRFAVALRESDRAFLRITSGSAGHEPLGVDPGAEAVAIGAHGDRIYTARHGEVAGWDGHGELVFVLQADDAPLVDVATSLDGRWVAAGGIDGSVYLWNVSAQGPGGGVAVTPRARFFDQTERVPALAFSHDGRWFASGSWDRTLRVRDLGVVDAPAAALALALERRYRVDLTEALSGPPRGRDARRGTMR